MKQRTDEEKAEEFKRIKELATWLKTQKVKAANFRGSYIQAVSEIEEIIDEGLCLYFFPEDVNRRLEFNYSMLTSDKMTLGHKVSLFCFLVERHCKELYDKHFAQLSKSEKKLNPNRKTLGNRIDDLISTRNKFAHRTSQLIQAKGDPISLSTVIASV